MVRCMARDYLSIRWTSCGCHHSYAVVNVDWNKLGGHERDILRCEESDYCGQSEIYCDME